MARQSIPRSDLYGDLGVDPSADVDAIESAYRELIDPLGGSDVTADVRRAARLRVAREWLTDPDLRGRYDAARARAAARAEKAAAEEAQAFAATGFEPGAPEPAPGTEVPEPGDSTVDSPTVETPAPDIPWPVRDLQRESPDIQWSTTPADAMDDRSILRRRRGLQMGVLGLVGLAAVVMLVTYALATNVFFTNVASNPTATPNGAAASQAAQASAATSELPSAVPTVAPSTPPASLPPPSLPPPSLSPSGVPVEIAAMQQAAWQTLESLRAAAGTGDVTAAQAYLGETAPGLRRSGLRRATFPVLEASAITIDASDTPYLALAEGDRLTSPDGVAWTFDYGDRPLAAYRSPSGEPVHDLWWEEADGRHHLFVQVSVATLSRDGVAVDVRWSFDPARPDDATYFGRSGLVVTSVLLDGSPVDVVGTAERLAGQTSHTVTATFTVVEALPARLSVGITFTNPKAATSDDRAIETVFALDVR